jgi:DNA-binding protein H-NS
VVVCGHAAERRGQAVTQRSTRSKYVVSPGSPVVWSGRISTWALARLPTASTLSRPKYSAASRTVIDRAFIVLISWATWPGVGGIPGLASMNAAQWTSKRSSK